MRVRTQKLVRNKLKYILSKLNYERFSSILSHLQRNLQKWKIYFSLQLKFWC